MAVAVFGGTDIEDELEPNGVVLRPEIEVGMVRATAGFGRVGVLMAGFRVIAFLSGQVSLSPCQVREKEGKKSEAYNVKMAKVLGRLIQLGNKQTNAKILQKL